MLASGVNLTLLTGGCCIHLDDLSIISSLLPPGFLSYLSLFKLFLSDTCLVSDHKWKKDWEAGEFDLILSFYNSNTFLNHRSATCFSNMWSRGYYPPSLPKALVEMLIKFFMDYLALLAAFSPKINSKSPSPCRSSLKAYSQSCLCRIWLLN